MKKRIYILILVALIGVSATTVSGKEANYKTENRIQISEKEAQLNTIEFINNLNISIDDITDYSNDVQDLGENKVYSICWTSSEKNLSFWVDAHSGEIMSFSQRIFNEGYENITAMTREDSLELANKILKELYPEISKDYKANLHKESYYGNSDNSYEFEFYKFVNHIPYLDEGARLSINKFTGELMDIFPFRSNNIGQFHEIKNVKSKEYADKVLRENANADLVYRSYTYDGNLRLIYAYDHSRPAAINATTGKFIDLNPNFVVDQRFDLGDKEREHYASEGIKNLNSKILSTEEAEKRLKFLAESLIYNDSMIMRIEKYEEYNPNENKIVWSGIIEIKGERQAIINMDAYGNIKDIATLVYNDIDKLDENKEFDIESLYKKALDIIVRYMPNKLKDIDLSAYCAVSNVYDGINPIECVQIRFPKVINGIRVIGEDITLTFTDNKGTIINIQDYIKETEESVRPENIISKQEAINKYFTKLTNILCYEDYYDANGNYLGILPVYRLNTNLGISEFPTGVDAITGEFLYMSGN